MTPLRLLLPLLAVLVSPTALAYDLAQHLWQHRLLFLIADDADDPRLVAQRAAVESLRNEVIDRDLRVFELFARSGSVDGKPLSERDVSELRRQLALSPGDGQLILIGKDGGIKRRGTLDTGLEVVFDQIDAMPMRRQEMRNRQRRAP